MPSFSRDRCLEALLVSLGLTAAVFALYARCLDGPFVFDDHIQLLRNRAIQLRELGLASLRAAAFESPSRRPVANLSFALNYWYGGASPRGYRVVNLLLHAANGALVYALARVALRRRPLARGDPRLVALLAALLFALHPLQTQSVSYVVQRMNLLCALFSLAAIGCYSIARERPPGRRGAALLACAASFALALGSKQNAVTLPAALFLWEWFLYRDLDPAFARRVARRALPPLLLAGGLVWWWIFQGPYWGYNAKPFTLGERLLTQGRAIALYVGLALLPLPSRLNLLHDFPVSRSLLDPPSTLPALLAVLGAAALATARARSAPWLAFGTLWFLLHLAVESSLLPLDLVYEHRTYLPLAGVGIAAAVGLARACGGAPGRLAAVGALLALPLALWTWQRNAVWADAVALWSDVVAKSPANPLARSNLAAALAYAGRDAEALAEAERALQLDPSSARLHANLGVAYSRLARWALAEEHLRRALAAWPDDAELHGSLGTALLRQGDRARAREHFERAAALDPRSARAAYNLALLESEERNADAALRGFERAVDLDPDYAEAHQAFGWSLEQAGELERAVSQYREALRIAPTPSASARLGWALARQGHEREARDELLRALRGNPGMPLARAHLAWLEARSADPELRDPPSALRRARRALAELGGAHPHGLEALAAAEAANGRPAEAARLAREAAARAFAQGDAAAANALAAQAQRYEEGEDARTTPGR